MSATSDNHNMIIGQESKDIERSNHHFSCMNTFRLTGLYTDISVLVAGTFFPAHKVVLASLSTYFHFKLQEQGGTYHISLGDVRPDIFSSILDYAYTGCVYLNHQNVHGILTAAMTYSIPYLVNECQNFMIFHLKKEDVCVTLHFAVKCGLRPLKRGATRYFTKHLRIMMTDDSFLSIEPKLLKRIFQDDQILIGGYPILNSSNLEATILTAVLIYQSKKRLHEKMFRKLLYTVRLAFIESDDISRIVVSFNYLIDNSEILRMFLAHHSAMITDKRHPSDSGQNVRVSYFKFVVDKNRYGVPALSELACLQDFGNSNPEILIDRITVWIRPGDKQSPWIFGGINVTYRKGDVVLPEFNHSSGSFLEEWVKETVQLNPGEGITGLHIWTYKSSLISAVSFLTSAGRYLGPIGTPIGNIQRVMAPEYPYSYLYAMACDNDITLGATAITNIGLKWILF